MAKHEKAAIDLDMPYERNTIGLRGIFIFAGGLLVLIVVTFGLMAVLLNFLNKQYVDENEKSSNPMQLSSVERLPPEPRLQAAPGFGVDGKNGRVNLELKAPQSERWELEKIWKDEMENGQKDPQTGMVVTLPINEAKNKLIEQNVKATPLAGEENPLDNSRMYVSDSSAGRMSSLKRR